MNLEIVDTPLCLEIHGFSGVAMYKDYAGKAFELSGRMWEVVKGNRLPNKGKNIWVYEENDLVFAGVELDSKPPIGIAPEYKSVVLERYAYLKHIGPYNLIQQTGKAMADELRRQGLEAVLPYIEIYGHWTGDASTSEVELLMCLK